VQPRLSVAESFYGIGRHANETAYAEAYAAISYVLGEGLICCYAAIDRNRCSINERRLVTGEKDK
jgi:hypothetical protein